MEELGIKAIKVKPIGFGSHEGTKARREFNGARFSRVWIKANQSDQSKTDRIWLAPRREGTKGKQRSEGAQGFNHRQSGETGEGKPTEQGSESNRIRVNQSDQSKTDRI
jgi:hypothetical protein